MDGLSYGRDYVEPEGQVNSDGDHDDGAAEGQSNLAAGLKPAHAGHIDIQKNQIRVLADNHFDGFLPVLRQYDVVAVTRKRGLQDPTDLRLIVPRMVVLPTAMPPHAGAAGKGTKDL